MTIPEELGGKYDAAENAIVRGKRTIRGRWMDKLFPVHPQRKIIVALKTGGLG